MAQDDGEDKCPAEPWKEPEAKPKTESGPPESEPEPASEPKGQLLQISANLAGEGSLQPMDARRGRFVFYTDDDPSALIALVVKILDEMEANGIDLEAMPVKIQIERVIERARELAGRTTVSDTTLRDAKRYRREHPSK